jgi:hypothetical protein
MATESLPFIFGEVAKAKTKDQKKATLIKYDNSALRELLRYAFDPNLKFLLPPGVPPYRFIGDASEPSPTYLYGLVRKLYLFVEGGNTALKQSRREYLFIELLESIHPSEAELLLQIKDKKIKCRGLTYNLVKDTFPELLP